jgi:4-hydroxy-3-methylbut-2-enyl diphosphate reductase
LIDDEDEIDSRWLADVETVGLTSGASAPEELVVRVCEWFRARGVTEIRELAGTREDVVFRPPRELRASAA